MLSVALITAYALVWIASAFSVVCLAWADLPESRPTIDTLIARCRGLSGWALVERAQREVHAAMPDYGWFNGLDTPRLALARGCGVCWQRALVLRAVLTALGVEAWAVRAFWNRFPNGLRSGHAWLKVRLGSEVRDVCPGAATNLPGVVHFVPLTRVRRYGWGTMVFGGWLGSAVVNVFAALVQLGRGISIAAPARVPWRRRLTHNGFWLMTPMLAWNAALTSHLPPAFADDGAVPTGVSVAEAAGRLLVIGGAALLTVGTRERWQRRGLALFAAGTALDLASWLPLLFMPGPWWLGLFPYVLPAVWLTGLGLMSRSSGYVVAAALFSIAHATHGWLALAPG